MGEQASPSTRGWGLRIQVRVRPGRRRGRRGTPRRGCSRPPRPRWRARPGRPPGQASARTRRRPPGESWAAGARRSLDDGATVHGQRRLDQLDAPPRPGRPHGHAAARWITPRMSKLTRASCMSSRGSCRSMTCGGGRRPGPCAARRRAKHPGRGRWARTGRRRVPVEGGHVLEHILRLGLLFRRDVRRAHPVSL